MFLQDVRVEDVIEITGHSDETAMGYYRRINTQLMRDTLSHRDLRTILKKIRLQIKKVISSNFELYFFNRRLEQ
jgi:hypothetical protein